MGARRTNGEGSWSEVTLRGKIYQMYRVTINGKRKSFYGKTKREALDKYKNSASKPGVQDKSQSMTFQEYCYDWLIRFKHDKVKPKTYDYYESIIRLYIQDTDLGKTKIRKLNNMDFKEYTGLFQSHIRSFSGKSKSTVDGIHTVLTQVCKHGETYQDFSRNYMAGVTKLTEKEVKTKKKAIKALEYEDVMKLWNEMLRKNTEEDRISNFKVGTYVYGIGAYALVFCCFTGLRWGEVSALCWKDIQSDNGNYYFRVDKQYVTVKNRDNKSDTVYSYVLTNPKSEKSTRYIPLTSRAVEILGFIKERYPEICNEDHLIFSTTNKPYGESVAHRLLRVMCRRAGIPEVSPHALRHSFASILLNEDEKSIYTVSEMLGHSSADVTYKRYIEIFEKNKVNTINIFDNIDKKGLN